MSGVIINSNILSAFKDIKVFVFDIDGVLTDGKLLITEEGNWLRQMNIKDGYALSAAVKKGFKIWIISGAKNEAIKRRLTTLGINEIHTEVSSKKELLQSIARKEYAKLNEILYMGDDIPDIAVMKICGLPCAPFDAVEEVKEVSTYISSFKGGEGCVRDVIEKVMKLNGCWTIA